MSIEKKQLEYSLNNWNFEEAKKLLQHWSEKDANQLPIYCRFLADTGHLHEINSLFQTMILNPYQRQLMINKEFAVFKNLRVFHSNLCNKYITKADFFSKLYHYSMINDLESLSETMKNRGGLINRNTSAEDNMILNFAINRLANENYLDASIIKELIDHIANAKSMNSQRRKYMLAKLVSYAISVREIADELFNLKDDYIIHVKLVPLIYSLSNGEKGADLLMSRVYNFIKQLNNLKMYSEDRKPKVAICISGMFKSDMTNLDSIISTLVKPLDADVFIHTWDRQQEWGGDMRRYNFWPRVFGINKDEVPKNLLNLQFLKDNYLEVYNCLISSSFSGIDKEKLQGLIYADSIVIENEGHFLESHQIDEEFKTRGVYNQVKMFYGLYKSFEQVLNKEIQEGFQYDYIIRLRPDTCVRSSTVNYEHLLTLDNSALAVPAGSGWGISDGYFYANRSVYERAVGLWKEMLLSRKLSPFPGFEGWDSHKLFGLWLLKQDIRPVNCRFSCFTLFAGETFKVPNLLNALKIDCSKEMYSKFPKETEWLATFLADKAK